MTGDSRKIRKSAQGKITFTIDLISENVINSIRIWLFLKIKDIGNFKKPVCILENEAACACTTLREYFRSQLSVMQFNTLV